MNSRNIRTDDLYFLMLALAAAAAGADSADIRAAILLSLQQYLGHNATTALATVTSQGIFYETLVPPGYSALLGTAHVQRIGYLTTCARMYTLPLLAVRWYRMGACQINKKINVDRWRPGGGRGGRGNEVLGLCSSWSLLPTVLVIKH